MPVVLDLLAEPKSSSVREVNRRLQPAMLVDIDDEELFFVSEREDLQRHVPSRSNSRLLSSDAI